MVCRRIHNLGLFAGLLVPSCFSSAEFSPSISQAPLTPVIHQEPYGEYLNQTTVSMTVHCGNETCPASWGLECFWRRESADFGTGVTVPGCAQQVFSGLLNGATYEYSVLTAPKGIAHPTRRVTIDTMAPAVRIAAPLRIVGDVLTANFGLGDLGNFTTSDSGAPIVFSYCWNETSYAECERGPHKRTECPTPECTTEGNFGYQIALQLKKMTSSKTIYLRVWALDDAGNENSAQANVDYDSSPMPMPATSSTSIAVGNNSSCAIVTAETSDSTNLYCWGDSRLGQLGRITDTNLAPAPARGLTKLDLTPLLSFDSVRHCAIYGGFNTFCALTVPAGTNCPLPLDGENENSNTHLDLYCWGATLKVMGSDFEMEASPPAEIPPINDLWWRAVSIGRGHICALNSAGGLYCWGDNQEGQVGPCGAELCPNPTQVAHPQGKVWKQVSVSLDFSCAVDVDGEVWCWGAGQRGAAGVRPLTWTSTPTALSMPQGAEKYCEVRTTDRHVFVRAASNGNCDDAYADGKLYYVDLGHIDLSEPNPQLNPKHIAARGSTFCFIQDHEVACLGDNEWGHLGQDSGLSLTLDEFDASTATTYSIYTLPSPSSTNPSLTEYSVIAVSASHWCGIASANSSTERRIACAGSNEYGQSSLSRPVSTSPIQVTRAVNGGVEDNWFAVSAGRNHTCAITSSTSIGSKEAKELYCWGRRWKGQMGEALEFNLGRPQKMPILDCAGAPYSVVAAGGFGTLAIDANNQICGWTQKGSLLGKGPDSNPMEGGTGVLIPNSTFLDINGQTFRDLVIGQSHACAVTTQDGDLYCWGQNRQEENIPGNRTDPYQPPTAADLIPTSVNDVVFSMTAGLSHTCVHGMSADACYGDNQFYQLGSELPNITSKNTIDGNNWFFSAGDNFTCGYPDPDQDAHCWGKMTSKIAFGPATGSSPAGYQRSPPNGSEWIHVSAGANHACFISKSVSFRSVHCIGSNTHGQLGLGEEGAAALEDKDRLFSVSTIGISIEGKFARVAAGGNHTCALTDHHKLYCWGSNAYGQLGVGAGGLREAQVIMFAIP